MQVKCQRGGEGVGNLCGVREIRCPSKELPGALPDPAQPGGGMQLQREFPGSSETDGEICRDCLTAALHSSTNGEKI